MVADPILVPGATGGQGGAVTGALLDRGAPVRALVRDLASSRARRRAARGVETVTGALDDRASLAAAMRGARAVFALAIEFAKEGADIVVADIARQVETVLGSARCGAAQARVHALPEGGTSTLRSVWICHRCEVLGADPVMVPECWNCGGPVTVTARTTPSGVDNQMSGVVAREGRAA